MIRRSRIFFSDPACLWYPFLILLQFISFKCLSNVGCKLGFRHMCPKMGPGRKTEQGRRQPNVIWMRYMELEMKTFGWSWSQAARLAADVRQW